MDMHDQAHPGEVLREYMGASEVTAFATKIGVDRTTLSRLLNGRAAISAPTALKLEQVLGNSAEMWMNMRATHDLWSARHKGQSRQGRKPQRAVALDRPISPAR